MTKITFTWLPACITKTPPTIRSNSLYRDQYSSDDTFALILDTFNDNENALWFFTTQAGTQQKDFVERR